jgi:hemerythrin HHE cation binding domain-containing protein
MSGLCRLGFGAVNACGRGVVRPPEACSLSSMGTPTNDRTEAAGAIARFLTDDHARLGALLERAFVGSGEIDRASYAEFREGLLRHIGIEEKILLPAVARVRGGAPFPDAARLRLDHGAIASLLVPSPNGAIAATLRGILRGHDAIEEGPGGLYQTSDQLLEGEAADLVARMRSTPLVPVHEHVDTPEVMAAMQRALARAGYELAR